MNFIHHFRNVVDRMADDPEIRGNHVSLYIALFYHWNRFRFRVPLAIIRDDMMQRAKIASTATYTRCLKDLERLGYLTYEPSCSPYRPSYVRLVKFEKGARKGTAKGNQKRARQPAEKLNEPEVNNTNLSNSTNPLNSINHDHHHKKEIPETGRSLKSSKKTGGHASHDNCTPRMENPAQRGRPDTLEEVKAWFAEQQAPVAAAEKFYHYYESIGWKVGGKTAIKNWKASARYWMMNEKTPPHDTPPLKPGALHVAPHKNYNEPL